jgi:LuxR family transcriptional regulator, quorum-sensing system regulator BjaR1
MLQAILSLADPALREPDLAGAAHALHGALGHHGCTYLQSRGYRRPVDTLTARNHWAAGGFIARYARAGWSGSSAFNYICFDRNPLLDPIRRGLTRYRFSDFAPHGTRDFGDYWEALSEADIADALCATAYGADRRISSFHIGFDRTDFAPQEAESIQMAALLVAEKFIGTIEDDEDEQRPRLTARERDAIAFVAEGKTDWEIATILGISEPTARFHVDNARRKLDAVNRAHAVARFLARYGV